MPTPMPLAPAPSWLFYRFLLYCCSQQLAATHYPEHSRTPHSVQRTAIYTASTFFCCTTLYTVHTAHCYDTPRTMHMHTHTWLLYTDTAYNGTVLSILILNEAYTRHRTIDDRHHHDTMTPFTTRQQQQQQQAGARASVSAAGQQEASSGALERAASSLSAWANPALRVYTTDTDTTHSRHTYTWWSNAQESRIRAILSCWLMALYIMDITWINWI